jgi:superfamily I DNA/RNA helicase
MTSALADLRLDQWQLAAATDPSLSLDVQAAAGSGKTRMLLGRAAWLAEQGHLVRCYSYTVAAAAELQRRVRDLPPALTARIECSTIHSHAAEVCRGSLQRVHPFARGWSVIGEVEEKQLVKDAKEGRSTPERLKLANGLLTYAEMLRWGTELLQDSGICARTAGRAVLVDERQDLSPAELSFVHATSPASLTMVGDNGQQIYGWRGVASCIGARWQQLQLPLCYRCRPEICAAANRLHVSGLEMVPVRPAGGRVETIATGTDDELAVRIAELLRAGGCWAVLSRTRRRLLGLRQQLELAGVPVHAPGLQSDVWESAQGQVLVDLLHVLANAHDSLHLRRCLSRAGMSRAELLRAEAGRCGLDACSLWDWCCDHLTADSAPAALLRRIEAANRTDAREAALLLDATDLLEQIPAGLSVVELLSWLASPREREQVAEPSAGAVTLSTIHGAKGLEWDGVVVMGLEDGHLPLIRRGETDEAEERRLLYVAMTRAMDHLVLHNSANRLAWDGRTTSPALPSRFLSEIGGMPC